MAHFERRSSSASISLAALICLFYSCAYTQPQASAQAPAGTVRLACPKEASNRRLFEQTIRAKILGSFDPASYSKASVSVRLRLAGKPTPVEATTVDEVLSGMSINQNGVAFTAEGSLQFPLTCTYRYIAIIKIGATEISSGLRLRALTQSALTLTSGGSFKVKKIIFPPTPTPAPTSTPSDEDTDDGGQDGDDDREEDEDEDDEFEVIGSNVRMPRSELGVFPRLRLRYAKPL